MNYKNYNDYELIYMVRENDDYSYDILFNKYLPIIKNIAKQYYKSYNSYGYDLDDFEQECYIGFQKAIINYNDSKNAIFYTFATLCIERHIISFCTKISNSKKNISNIYLESIEKVNISDNLDILNDYCIYNSNIKEIWNIIYNKNIDYISVFELRWNHFEFSEIGKLLDIPKRRAQSIYRNCILYIQKQLRYSV